MDTKPPGKPWDAVSSTALRSTSYALPLFHRHNARQLHLPRCGENSIFTLLNVIPVQGWSVFTSALYRRLDAQWLFLQEKATFDAVVM
jgi:hypothetical protein